MGTAHWPFDALSGHLLGGARTIPCLRMYSQSAGQNSNPGPLKYEVRILTATFGYYFS